MALRLVRYVGMGLFVLLACSGHPETHDRTATQTDGLSATRDHNRIILHPSGLSFAIPQQWIESSAKTMHLSKRELEAIANTNKGEWDAEFTRFLNVAIPFDRCVAHVGSEGWGPNSRSFGDLQVRVYDIDGPGVGLEDQIVKAAKETVKPNGIRRYPTNNGTRLIIGYPRTHFDYVGSAEVRFEIRRYKDRTIVFVFMTMTNHASEIREILESIRVDPAK